MYYEEQNVQYDGVTSAPFWIKFTTNKLSHKYLYLMNGFQMSLSTPRMLSRHIRDLLNNNQNSVLLTTPHLRFEAVY